MVEALRVGISNPVEQLDPHEAIDYAAGLIQLQIFETPVRLEDGRLLPHLVSVPRSDGGSWKRWRVTVDRSHRFSDGTALTPQIVAASLLRCGRLGPDASVSAEGDDVIVDGAALRSRPVEALSSPYCSIVTERDGALLGTGPYRRAPDSTTELVRIEPNPHHVGPPPSLEAIEFAVFDDERRLIDEIGAGRVDFTNALSPGALASVRRARTQFLPGPSTAMLWLHCERLPDRRVRAAIAAAIDRAAITRLSFTDPGTFGATSVVPNSFAEFDDGLHHDPDRARSLLADAGIPLPLRLKALLIFSPRAYLPRPRETMDLIVQQLAAVGVTLEVAQASDPAGYRRRVATGDWDVMLAGWSLDETSIPVYLDSLFSAAAIPREDGHIPGCNFSRWDDATTESLLNEVHAGEDDAVPNLLKHLHGEVPVIALHHGCIAMALGERVRGREFDTLGLPLFASFTLARSRR